MLFLSLLSRASSASCSAFYRTATKGSAVRGGGGEEGVRMLSHRGMTKVLWGMRQFNPRVFFEEHYFWNHANTGPFFIALFSAPFIYTAIKNMYWTVRFRHLDQSEILSDRFTWLHERMLEDEVEAVLLEKVPAGGFPEHQPGLMLGPASFSSH
eukprot:GHVQ01022594.1.p1 GENE.GHVQ01022594.1~~GHVQ01022594.1.p1  ORF type:complete len:154 (+),score=26.30 GHVQ01022594.1:288-749(+)